MKELDAMCHHLQAFEIERGNSWIVPPASGTPLKVESWAE